MWKRVETRERWRRCAPPYSFYEDLIAKYWAGGPSEASGSPIHRICTLARKMDVRSVIVQDGLQRPDIAEEIAHLEEWAQVDEGEVTASVLTFLSSGVRRKRDFDGIKPGTVLGQAVVITFPMTAGQRS